MRGAPVASTQLDTEDTGRSNPSLLSLAELRRLRCKNTVKLTTRKHSQAEPRCKVCKQQSLQYTRLSCPRRSPEANHERKSAIFLENDVSQSLPSSLRHVMCKEWHGRTNGEED